MLQATGSDEESEESSITQTVGSLAIGNQAIAGDMKTLQWLRKQLREYNKLLEDTDSDSPERPALQEECDRFKSELSKLIRVAICRQDFSRQCRTRCLSRRPNGRFKKPPQNVSPSLVCFQQHTTLLLCVIKYMIVDTFFLAFQDATGVYV